MGGQHLARNRRSSLLRSGHSLIEVVAGLTLGTLLMVPTIGMLTASARIWQRFESGHGSIVTRQATIREIARRLEGATQLVGRVNGSQLRFIGAAGDSQRIFQRGTEIYWQQSGTDHLIGQDIGTLSFASYLNGTQPIQGRVVDVRLRNPRGTSGNNQESRLLVWVKPVI